MPGMPDLPIDIPTDHVQEDGSGDKAPVYQTHRGKKATSRDTPLPPQHTPAQGFGRYVEDE